VLAIRSTGPPAASCDALRDVGLLARDDGPSVISQHQGLTLTSELSVETLREFIEATRGRAGPSLMEESPLPRARRLDD
jgi:hypothetical protein